MEEHNEIINIEDSELIENMDNLIDNDLFEINSNIDFVKCYIFYVENDKILNLKKTQLDIKENKITKKELLSIALKHNKIQNKKCDLTGIYKYELSLEPDKIKDFCKSSCDFSFITRYHNIEDILFKPGIELFNDNNTLILFFSYKKNKSIQQPKQISKPKNKTQKKVKFNLKNKTMKSNDE